MSAPINVATVATCYYTRGVVVSMMVMECESFRIVFVVLEGK
jgi:hypothetical protein